MIEKQIRAYYTDDLIRVYQAYSHPIADTAVANTTFVSPPFSMTRMTWIKPSFFWMMYRAGWAMKQGQERILAIDITRSGFDWAVNQCVLSCFDPTIHQSKDQWDIATKNTDVIVQWDPERNMFLEKQDYRSIQIGIRNKAVDRYVNQWIKKITDITPTVHTIKKLIDQRNIEEVKKYLPIERPYPLTIKG